MPRGPFDPQEATRAKGRLRRRCDELAELLADSNQPNFLRNGHIALDFARSTVQDLFGEDSWESASFWAQVVDAAHLAGFGALEPPEHTDETLTARAMVEMHEAKARLESLARMVDERTISDTSAPGPETPKLSRRVFLVHGHNEETKEKVARLLEHLDLPPIILHEQPDMNRTLIEKFEAYTPGVGFAVILMTADDRGGPKEKSTEEYQPRARQNVLFEMGFFLGKLGRRQVCVLREPTVEIPSDYAGVLYKTLDAAGAWKLDLAREIDAAGIAVDLKRLYPVAITPRAGTPG